MNTTLHTTRRTQIARTACRPRRGSVLVVVLALLSALMLLGFLFYTIASQERENARYFTASEKWYGAELSPDELFDFALEQIIVGPRDDYANSALWGGRYSLLASLVGDDIQPYSGPGVNIVDDSQMVIPLYGGQSGAPVVDQERDGAETTTANQYQLMLNIAEWATALPGSNVRADFAKPDVGYTYPDLNSPFLAYIGTEPTTGDKVIIPSFHRPQYLRGLFNNPPATPTVPPSDWYIDPLTKPYVLRPHAERKIRKFDYTTGTIVESTMNRFTDASVVVPPSFSEGHWEWDGTAGAPAATGFYELDVDADKDGVKEAVLLDLDFPIEETPDGTTQFIPLFAVTLYDLDALLNLNSHGNLYGDAEDLFALPFGGGSFVSKGNDGRQRHQINPEPALDAGLDATPGVSAAHTDFFGHAPVDATELANMELWFLLAGRVDYDVSGGIKNYYMGRWGEQVRLDAAYGARSPSAYDYPRPGESLKDEKIGTTADGNRGLRHNDFGLLFPQSVIFPAPGAPEDNQGQGTYVGGDGKTPLLQRMISAAAGAQGRVQTLGYASYWTPGLAGLPGTFDPVWSLEQLSYNFAPQIVGTASIGVRAISAIYGNLAGRHVDDPGETLLDPDRARDQATDQIFGPEEAAYLHLDGPNPASSYSLVSRLLNLVPANFRDSTNAEERRKRFTTISTDLKSYSLSPGLLRTWETRQDLAASTSADELPFANVFPPVYGPLGSTVDVFRPEARGLLQHIDQTLVRQNAPGTITSYNSDILKRLIRKLSVNQVATAYITDRRDQRPRFVLRPVTPHPTPTTIPAGSPPLTGEAIPVPVINDAAGNPLAAGTGRPYFGVSDQLLSSNRLTTQSMANPPTASGFVTPGMVPWPAAMQEWYARRDRQNLARDIYTLLYTLGHVDPAMNVATTPNVGGAVYTEAQLREMAQFAVNVVDAMDPDDTITAFIYDKNLADGYTLLDDGYAVDQPASTDTARGIVFGVEAQKLAFNEVMAVFAKKYSSSPGGPGTNHGATQWNDTYHRDFVYVELQNMWPAPVPMNGGWSVVIEPDIDSATTYLEPSRSLTIADGSQARAASVYTIGVAGDRHIDQSGNALEDSVMRVDPNADASATPADPMPVVAPAGGTTTPGVLDFDPLVAATTNSTYRVNEYDASQPWGDGAPLGDPPPFSDPDADAMDPDPKAGVWLDLGPQSERDNIDPATPINVRLRLRRRLNLNRAVPDQLAADSFQDAQKDNPWVEVDVITVPLRIFSLASSGATDVQTALQTQVISSKRTEPLDRHPDPSVLLVGQGARETSPYQQNNLGGYHTDDIPDAMNPNRGAQIWQRHFDRSFATLADVLMVPLYGPQELTARLSVSATAPAVVDQTAVAAARFLFPDTEPRLVGDPAVRIRAAGNVWYRLFEFIEVPQKYGDDDGLPWFAHYGGPSPWGVNARENLRLREFGKLNLNTMRHPHVLAGLLDDLRVFTLTDPDGALPYNPSMPTANGENWLGTPGDRNWWLSMLASRDGGLDPYPYPTGTPPNVILPGLPSAKPFLSFSPTSAPKVGGVLETFNRTFLRNLPVGPTLNTPEAGLGRRSLLELGETVATPPPSGLGSDADLTTRYRMLGKVLNHGTTRSNTYVAFITCDFYDATAVDDDGDPATPDVFQIGARLPADSDTPGSTPEPRYRGFFVIDRTKALELLKRRDLPPSNPALKWPPGPNNNIYSTYSFAREQGSDGRPTPTFDWKELVLYRKVLKAQ